MKIGICSDEHFSLTSSIMTRVKGCKYSHRLDILVKSSKWLYEKFKENNVDIIIHTGDYTNSPILLPEENSAISEALSYRYGTKEYFILGNHEIKDKENRTNSLSILSGYKNLEIIDKIKTIDLGNNKIGILAPYSSKDNDYENVYEEVLKNENKEIYLFTHSVYMNESLGMYISLEGLDKDKLNINNNIKMIFNGHIHTSKDEGFYHQVGTISGMSFNDTNNILPGIIVVDTDKDSIERIPNPHASLYYTLNYKSNSQAEKFLDSLPSNEKYIRIKVNMSDIDRASSFIKSNASRYNIEEYRIKVEGSDQVVISKEVIEENSTTDNEKEKVIEKYSSVYDALLNYINYSKDCQYEENFILNYLNKYFKE